MDPAMEMQHVVVMRHGDRIDAVKARWVVRAERPWDPPLTEEGKLRAWTTGKKLRRIGFPIHRVVVSPFLRCLQTAREIVIALCAVVDDSYSCLLAMESSEEASAIDPSRIKVHIEYGLCEVLCSQAMRIEVPAKDGKWFPDVSELEAFFPSETLDHSVDRIYQKMPLWEEPVDAARSRYENVIMALADKFPHENLLLVSHGEAVGVSVSSFAKGSAIEVLDVEYCAISHLQRRMAEKFEVLTENAKSGVCYFSEKKLQPQSPN